jgi:hypothetical protein
MDGTRNMGGAGSGERRTGSGGNRKADACDRSQNLSHAHQHITEEHTPSFVSLAPNLNLATRHVFDRIPLACKFIADFI